MMSINSINYKGNVYIEKPQKRRENNEKRKKEIKKMVEDMQQEGEEPLSDEEFQELIEFATANINEKRNSLDERKIWERFKMYTRRKKLLAEEVLRLKKESDEEKGKKVDDLKNKLNDGNNTIEIPTYSNTFKKK